MPPPPPPSTAARRGGGGALPAPGRGRGGGVLAPPRDHAALRGRLLRLPGGRVDKADALVPVEGAGGEDAALRVAAARELLEETGVLVAAGRRGALARSASNAMRRALLDGERAFAALLARARADAARGGLPRRGAVDHAAASCRAASTPASSWWRRPPTPRPELLAGRAGGGRVGPPAGRAARAGRRAPALLHPPALHALQVLADFTDRRKALRARWPRRRTARTSSPQRIEFQQGIRLFPLRDAHAACPPRTPTATCWATASCWSWIRAPRTMRRVRSGCWRWWRASKAEGHAADGASSSPTTTATTWAARGR